jgi:hypothetical protein
MTLGDYDEKELEANEPGIQPINQSIINRDLYKRNYEHIREISK